jgi:hypothetical protein
MVRRRHRGLGQVMPTCTYVDETQTIPQMVLAGGGSLAMLIGIIGAVASDEYRKGFAITAAAGLASSIAAGIWAAASINKNGVLGMGAQCTGPGLPELGLMSVNPDQTTPAGQQPGLFGPTTPTQSVYQATAGAPQITNPAMSPLSGG